METQFKINLIKPKTPAQVIKEKVEAVGNWKVTTAGDIEGGPTRQLGTYTGHVALIAFLLADKACYQLYFTKSDLSGEVIKNEIDTTRSEVHISFLFNDCPELDNMTVKNFNEWAGLNFIDVTESNFYKSIKLTLKKQRA